MGSSARYPKRFLGQPRQSGTVSQQQRYDLASFRPPDRRRSQRFRSTGAGFLPNIEKVPTRPIATIASTVAAAAASAGTGSQKNGRFITWVMMTAAAPEPAATPKTAVALPISRYSRP